MRRFAVVSSILTFIAPADVDAAEFVVTKTADTSDGVCDADCSLREAVLAANSGAFEPGEAVNLACGEASDVSANLRVGRGESRVITASDALIVLRTAVGSAECPLCVCDVNDSSGINARRCADGAALRGGTTRHARLSSVRLSR